MILIYAKSINARLEYICSFVFEQVMGTKYRITSAIEEAMQSKGPVINYSGQSIKSSIQIAPHPLLFEERIRKQKVDTGKWNNLITLFPDHAENDIPFDLFSASFYLITRYEEYTNKKRDKYDRFIAEESLAYQHGFLHFPLVDHWILKLKEVILSHFPDYTFKAHAFSFLPTIDIDNAWAYKHKGFVRTFGGMVRSLIKQQWGDLLRRFGVLALHKKDPFDTYHEMDKLHAKYKFSPIYFFLLRNNGKYDTSHSVKNKYFKKLIKNISKKHKVGIHPSYTSNSMAALIKAETTLLSSIMGKKVTRSRNHFLRIKFPHTYNALVKIGIAEDYSLGYSSQNGFRAGTSHPIYYFNLVKNVCTELKLYPFQVMDAAFKYYLKSKPEEAIQQIRQLIHESFKVKGTFCSIFHNEAFSGNGKWKRWNEVYEQMLRECNQLIYQETN